MESGPYLYFRWENRSAFRYYAVYLQKDLFNDWCLTRVWGRIDTPLGQIRHTPVDNYGEGLLQIEQIAKIRKRRGYVLR